jgi:2-dehydro-3-deoxygluconokinase
MSIETFISVGECMAELQLAEAGLYSLKFGGDTLNTAWYVRALARASQLNVQYFTAVGNDQLSKDLLQFLEGHDIGTHYVKEVPDRNLGLYLISLTGAERNFTYWRSSSAARLLAVNEGFLRSSLSEAQIIYFSGITLAILEPAHREVFLGILNEMKAKGITVAFDSNARRRLWPSDDAMRDAITSGYKVATLALPTFDDDRAIFGDEHPMNTARRIAGFGVTEIVVKDGANPCVVLTGGDFQSVTPESVTGVVDTTGAGDSFNAGYIVGRTRGLFPAEAAKLAHIVAGRVIRSRGALVEAETFADLTG